MCPLTVPPPPTAPALPLVAAPPASASGPASAWAGSLPFPLPPLSASARPPRAPCPTPSGAATAPLTAGTASSRAPRSVSLATSAAPSPAPVRSMIALGAAVPALAPFHTSTVLRPHVRPTSAYLECLSHARWNGLEFHCQHLSAGFPHTESEQNRHAYVPSQGSTSSSVSTLISIRLSIASLDKCQHLRSAPVSDEEPARVR